MNIEYNISLFLSISLLLGAAYVKSTTTGATSNPPTPPPHDPFHRISPSPLGAAYVKSAATGEAEKADDDFDVLNESVDVVEGTKRDNPRNAYTNKPTTQHTSYQHNLISTPISTYHFHTCHNVSFQCAPFLVSQYILITSHPPCNTYLLYLNTPSSQHALVLNILLFPYLLYMPHLNTPSS